MVSNIKHNVGTNGTYNGIIAHSNSFMVNIATQPALGPTVSAGDCSMTTTNCSIRNSSSGQVGQVTSAAAAVVHVAQLSRF